MRVLEPQKKKQIPVSKKTALFVGVLVSTVVFSLFLYLRVQPVEVASQSLPQRTELEAITPSTYEQLSPQDDYDDNGYRLFTDNEFKLFYDNLLQPNVKRIENPPRITESLEADARILSLAESRGYRLRSEPVVALISYGGLFFQEDAGRAWLALQATARKSGITILATSGYRSVDEQLEVLRSMIDEAGFTINDITTGAVDKELDGVLARTAPPGYSKHHTGYTVDLFCPGTEFYQFAESECFEWLSANNYQITKEHGFIPSYPPLADAQGPSPEAWEYVYVGSDLLTRN